MLAQAKFLVNQRIRGFDVPDDPCFDTKATSQWFQSRLASSSRYLEYGSGGSTVTAARIGIHFVTIDSDPFFLRRVREKIQLNGYAKPADQVFRYADIGFTGPWGRPIGPVSESRRQKFRRYSDPPPEYQDDHPDLVLIDGRFRVACALKAIRMLRDHTGWAIVVDDYLDRNQYHVIADFAHLEDIVGRMAVFTAAKSFERTLLADTIRAFETIPE